MSLKEVLILWGISCGLFLYFIRPDDPVVAVTAVLLTLCVILLAHGLTFWDNRSTFGWLIPAGIVMLIGWLMERGIL